MTSKKLTPTMDDDCYNWPEYVIPDLNFESVAKSCAIVPLVSAFWRSHPGSKTSVALLYTLASFSLSM